ncbi:unnamed protein product [Ixodes hexagonus]
MYIVRGLSVIGARSLRLRRRSPENAHSTFALETGMTRKSKEAFDKTGHSLLCAPQKLPMQTSLIALPLPLSSSLPYSRKPMPGQKTWKPLC